MKAEDIIRKYMKNFDLPYKGYANGFDIHLELCTVVSYIDILKSYVRS